MPGDGGDVDDGTGTFMQRRGKTAAELQRREQIELEDLVPGLEVAVETAEPFLVFGFGRHAGIVDKRVQRLVAEGGIGFLDEIGETVCIAQVGGDVAGPIGVALAGLGGVVARTGDDLPAAFQKHSGSGVANAAAGAGDNDDFPAFFHASTLGH